MNDFYYFEKSRIGFLEKAAQLLFPMATYCVCCGKIIDGTGAYYLCNHCRERIRWGRFHINLNEEAQSLRREKVLDSAVFCVKYGIYERRMIFDLKYDGKTYVARVIAAIMAERILSELETAETYTAADMIIPVPVFKEKEKKRGFNQASKIGFHLGRRLGVPHNDKILRRNQDTAAQRSLSAEERFFNLENVFDVAPEYAALIKGKTVILLDDVYTTGSTAWHCAGALRQAGAERVYLAAFASGNEFMLEK